MGQQVGEERDPRAGFSSLRQFMTSDVEDLKILYQRGLKPSRMTEWRERKKAEERQKVSEHCRPLTHWFHVKQDVRLPVLHLYEHDLLKSVADALKRRRERNDQRL